MSSTYQAIISDIHEALGIPPSYADDRKLSLQYDCQHLKLAGLDIFDREVKMQKAASQDGIELQLVSAYRSVNYQEQLIRKKLVAQQTIEEILKVNAAPGYSEHHSGRALDLTCPGAECLEQSFENTAAFAWLQEHAGKYGFHMSFPKNNIHGMLYEPWHWCYKQKDS